MDLWPGRTYRCAVHCCGPARLGGLGGNTMKVLRRSRRLARLAGCAALILALAGTAVGGSPSALARVTGPVVDQHAAVSWGDNENGQLGNGTTDNQVRYGGVSGLGGGVVQVSAGAFHGLAVTSGGTVWAWGHNGWGELGDGTVTSSSTPVQVPGLTGIVQVAAGVAYSLALRSDGTVWAWGYNQYGQVGDGVTGGSSSRPSR
jgi:Regulator of chromosome condensation (RCC1) repeat